MELSKKRLELIYEQFKIDRNKYNEMIDYYEGKSLVSQKEGYQRKDETRSNLITTTNFIKLFVDEEVSYSLGNDITYSSREGNRELIDFINYQQENLSESHDINLLRSMLITGTAYELSYINRDGEYAAEVIPSNEGYAVYDNYGDIELFMHCYTKMFDDKQYVDIYTDNAIFHLDDEWNVVAETDEHFFGEVPIGVATWNRGEDNTSSTIFSTSKNLQDAYETNMSDQTNEISDFRSAYLVITGASVDDLDLGEMKKQGVMVLPEGAKAEWLVKNLDADYVANSLSNIEDKLYSLNGHINGKENASDNSSFLAINARNQKLATKCELNQKGITDCIRFRIKMIIKASNITGLGRKYDYKDVFPVFVPNLPSDDFSTADMIDKLGDRLSLETGLSQLSFIRDSASEVDKITKEQNDMFGGDYDFLGSDGDE